VCFVISTAFFVWWQFFHDTEGEPREPKPKKKQAKPRPARKPGPKMAVPKGRVR
jgi:hypothetical protein